MHKLRHDLKNELRKQEKTGITSANLGLVGNILDMIKDIDTIEAMEESKMRNYRDYRGDDYEGDYRDSNYNRGGYNAYNDGGDYGRRGVPGSGRGRYNRFDERMMDRFDRIMEGMDMYQYGRERYRGGDNEERMVEGLEKLMYALCTFVESTMDFAETPQEKEIIRKHMQKLSKL